MLEKKGQVLHRVREHLKVPGWLPELDALLTRKLPMFLSRLNEISSGRGNICLVSGLLRRILNFENDIFDCKVLWMVDVVDGR